MSKRHKAKEHRPIVYREALACVRPSIPMVMASWPKIEPYIKRACDLSRGRFTSQWVAESALIDGVQVWIMLSANEIRGAFVTSVQTYPATGLRVVQILLLAGDKVMHALDHGRVELTAFKERVGAQKIEWAGRDGFGPLWPGAKRLGSTWEVE